MKKVFLILVIALAFFLRVYKLGSYPVGFLWDEAALGYNAFSILRTGRDEYGQLLPLIFKSFGDYKPGFYVYLTVPSILVFGLNEFAVRLPSALLGSLTVMVFYFLVKESLRKGFTQIGKRIGADLFPIICSVLLAISPWHIMFSRGAWELNVMLFEFVFGFYLLAKYFNNKKNNFLIFSILFFILTLFTYQSAKFLLPLLLAGYLFFNRDAINPEIRRRVYFGTRILVLIFIMFNFWTVTSGKAGRVKAMSIFSYPRSPEEEERFLVQDGGNHLVYNFFHGNPVFFVRSVLGRYFNHFSGKFLFITGDWSNQRNGVSYQGVMYYIDLVFLLAGLAALFAKKRTSLDNFILFWLLIAPLPAALTRDDISSVRSFTMVIPLIYITAVGVVNAFNAFKKNVVLRGFCYTLYAICYLLLLIRFLDLYFVHDPKYTSENRLYGYKQTIDYITPLVSQKNKIVFTNKYGQPYIFYLFYSKYDPGKYQVFAKLKENPWGDVGEIERIGNVEFRKIYFPDDRANENSLFIGDEFDLPLKDIVEQENIYFLKEIKFLNGKTAFRMVETK